MRFYLLFILLFLNLYLYPQVDRSNAPNPLPVKPLTIGSSRNFILPNGLKVIVIENHKYPLVNYSAYLCNPPVYEGERVGYVSILSDILGTGTRNYSMENFWKEIDKISGTIEFNTNYSNAYSLKKNNQELLKFFSESLLQPVFLKSDLRRYIVTNNTVLTGNLTYPGSVVENLFYVSVYGKKHPYGEIITIESNKKIKLKYCKDYFKKFYRPNNVIMTVVGDITIEEARKDMEQYFGEWKPRSIDVPIYPVPSAPSKNTLVLADMPGTVQSLIRIGYALDFSPANPDYFPAIVANMILGGGTFRLFMNLREKHAYTYGAYSELNEDKYGGYFCASTDVRTEVTDSAIQEILFEMKRMQDEKVDEKELQLAINTLSGQFALSLESPDFLASLATDIVFNQLDSNFYNNYLVNLQKVTIEEVQLVARKIFKPENCYIVVVGDAEKITEKLLPLSPDRKILLHDKECNFLREIQ